MGIGSALVMALIQVEEIKGRNHFAIRKNPPPDHPLEVLIFGYGLAYTSDPNLIEDTSTVLRVGKSTLELAVRNLN